MALSFDVHTAEQMEALGAALSKQLVAPCTVHLIGNLGAGKTTFVRGFVCGLGHKGAVKSPTYTIVEPYELDGKEIFHFDLYRLSDPEELEAMGIRDYLNPHSISLIEWPDKGEGVLPAPNLIIDIEILDVGRKLVFQPQDIDICEDLLANTM